jgi:predicted transcriptional regulator
MRTATAGREHLHVMLPRREKRQVDHLAAEQQRTKHELVLEAIRAYLANHEQPNGRGAHRPK